MRLAASVLLVGLCCWGCAPLRQVVSTVRYETDYRVSEAWLTLREHQLARRGWADFRRGNERLFTHEFKDGFLAGYKKFLHSGSGLPPAVPPRRLWSGGSASAAEKSAQWYRGFGQGAIAAEESGLRGLFLVPTASWPPSPTPLIVGIQAEPALEALEAGRNPTPERMPPKKVPSFENAPPANTLPSEPSPNEEFPDADEDILDAFPAFDGSSFFPNWGYPWISFSLPDDAWAPIDSQSFGWPETAGATLSRQTADRSRSDPPVIFGRFSMQSGIQRDTR